MRASALSSAGRKNNMQPLDQQPRSTSTTEAISCICRTCIRSTPYLNKRAAHTLYSPLLPPRHLLYAMARSSAFFAVVIAVLLIGGAHAQIHDQCMDYFGGLGGQEGILPVRRDRYLARDSIRLIKGVYTTI